MRRLSALAVGVLLVAACAGAASPSPATQAPAASQAPAATQAPASEAPPASVAPTERPEVNIKYGTASSKGFPDTPMLAAFDALAAEQNINVEFVQFEGGDQAARALAAREVDFGRTFPAQLMALASETSFRLFTTLKRNEWALVCSSDITAPEQISGRKIGRHAPTDVTAALVNNTINKYAITPEVLTIPGSENRVVALLQGELDCSPVDIGGVFVLEDERPGGFPELIRYKDELPNVIFSALLLADTDRVTEDPETWEIVTKYIVNYHRMAGVDADWLATEADKFFPDEGHDVHQRIAEAYVEYEAFCRDGCVGVESMTRLMQFYIDAGALKAEDLLPYDDYAAPDLVNAALEELGP